MTTALPMTIADIDEWIADVNQSQWSTHHVPNEWARGALGALLDEEIPAQVWTSGELLSLLNRARQRAA